MGGGESKQEKETDVRFNSDKSCIICLNDDGLQVHTVSPSPPTLTQQFHHGDKEFAKIFGFNPDSVYMIEMVHASPNQFVVVTGTVGSDLKYKRIVSVYNESTQRMEIQVAVKDIVLAVRCVNNKLIVVSESNTMIFWFDPDLKKAVTYRLDTRHNPHGICEISRDVQIVLVCMGRPESEVGSVQLRTLTPASELKRDVSEPEIILTHEDGELACIALNPPGTLLATASDKGTLIRVWDTKTREKLHEFRRGREYVTIKSIAFDPISSLLCCVSNKETGHIFSLLNSDQNTRSVFAGTGLETLGSYVTYVDSQWALSKFQVPVDTARVCAFISDKHIMVFSKDGSYRKFELNLETGECPLIECKNIFVEEDLTI